VSIIFVLILIGLNILGGTIMNKPLVSEKEIVLQYNIKTIWDIVVNNNDYDWRSDIKKIEIIDNGNWIEFYDIGGKYFTKFTLKEKEEYLLYSFDMENKNYYGTWVGKFVEINKQETKLKFTETIYIRNKVMNIFVKLFWNLGKIQERYFDDLIKKLKG
jgi:hypothetical protein